MAILGTLKERNPFQRGGRSKFKIPFVGALFGVWLATAFFCGVARGDYVQLEWDPIARTQFYEIQIEGSDHSSLNVKIPAPRTDWTGDLPAGTYQLRIRAIDPPKKEGNWSPSRAFTVRGERRWNLTPTLGVSSHSFQETGVSDYAATGVSVGGRGRYRFSSSSWRVGAETEITALRLGGDRPDWGTVRFLKVEGFGGYEWTLRKWAIDLDAGLVYRTMFVPDGDFGFRDLSEACLQPGASYRWTGRDVFSVRFELAPVLSSVGSFFDSRELGARLQYERVGESLTWLAGVSYARLQLNLAGQTISDAELALQFGMGW